ncbi:nickel pincer cofactor biosynthesis protein LarC [Mycolicibacterium flavescens]|uniref:Pyridinium-3,5-bisthiocarboxylic acid mononucleotide nickel insertion protein n=2 Tax=Mycolicibacterium flavescens TaxID=1776 RepID=A0A1E3RCX0_MYCFV|nr:nickel pincer cofactor biosynthesis protein LarC [Mycolicibacterium flavescens]ODQ87689.1 TIGR00299 family protein [Mycolicibacterium flavescens]
MLLGALIDAGASLPSVQRAVGGVVPSEVQVGTHTTRRAGLRAVRAQVTSVADDHPHRRWADIRLLLEQAPLTIGVRESALTVFTLLADAEARVHGLPAEEVTFHEVGSWDAIADVVGVCAALADLGVAEVTASPVALGSGRVGTAHGDLPVPAPAVIELARGWPVSSGGDGELATPTGMALLRGLAAQSGPIPAMTVSAVGVGAGSRDPAGRANVVRVVVGEPASGAATSTMWVLETNVDDIDPRVWPSVLAALLDAGAADAWLVPIVMKKGRPAHTLRVLGTDAQRATLRAQMFALTGTLGVREAPVQRTALDRAVVPVDVEGGRVRIKVGLRDGTVDVATPEFEDAATLAGQRGVPVRHVLDEANAAAAARGLRRGARWPAGGDPQAGAAI